MVALIVIGAIVALVVFLLVQSVVVELDFTQQQFFYKVRFLFITIVVNPESERRKRRKAKKTAKAKKKREKKLQKSQKKPQKAQKASSEKSSSEATSSDKPKIAEKHKAEKFQLSLVKDILDGAKPHIKRIFKKIRVYDLYIDFVIGGADAAAVAISYGTHCAAVYSLLEWLDSVIRLERREVNIEADFDLKKTDYFAHAKMKLRLSTMLHSGIWGFFAVLRVLNAPAKTDKANKQKKAA